MTLENILDLLARLEGEERAVNAYNEVRDSDPEAACQWRGIVLMWRALIEQWVDIHRVRWDRELFGRRRRAA